MLTTKSATIIIPAPRLAVWAHISDPRKEQPGGAVVEQVEERPGWFRAVVRTRVLGMTVRATLETTQYDPPATITVTTTGVTTRIPRWLLVSAERDTWTLTEAGEGATRIERTVQLRHQLPGAKRAGKVLRRQLRHVSSALGG